MMSFQLITLMSTLLTCTQGRRGKKRLAYAELQLSASQRAEYTLL